MPVRVLVATIVLVASGFVMAANDGDFDSFEYHISVATSDKLSYAPDELTDDFKASFPFLTFKAVESFELSTYIDTPYGIFNKHHIILRLREDLLSRSGKITVKFRAPSPEGFSGLKGYSKAEVDITEGHAAYSISYDIPYNTQKININNVRVKTVFDILKSKRKNVYALIKPYIKGKQAGFIQSIVMRSVRFEAKDKKYPDTEVDYAVWSHFPGKPKVAFAEFSFKGGMDHKPTLEAMYESLSKDMKAVGVLLENQGSKTERTFKMSPGFKYLQVVPERP